MSEAGGGGGGGGGAGLAVCRLCARPGGALISLFDHEAALRTCEKVLACAAVALARGDGLPDGLCAPCSADLEVAFAFRQRAQRADALLRHQAGLALVKPEFELVDCGDELVDCGSDLGTDLRPARRRSKKDFADFVQHDGSTSEDDDYRPERDEKRKKTRRKRKAFRIKPKLEPASDEDEAKFDSDDDVILVNTPPKKRKSPPPQVGKYPCPHCEKSFPYPSVLKLHMVTHTKEKSHKCLMCPETFLYSRSLYAHYKDVHPNESTKPAEEMQKSFPCGTCDKVFNQSKNLKVHEAMHLREKKYRCEGCDLGFTNMSILNSHKKREHPYLFQSLSCNYCNRNFKKKSSLERHLDNHRQISESNSTETKKAPLMKDLFKSIAPMTTTYWSDSFSD